MGRHSRASLEVSKRVNARQGACRASWQDRGAPEMSGVWGRVLAGDRRERQRQSMLTHCVRVTLLVPFYSVPYLYAVLRRCELLSL